MEKNNLPIAKNPVIGEVHLTGSKSLSNRVLLLAALSEGESLIENLPLNQDVLATIKVLEKLNIKFDLNTNMRYIKITGCKGQFDNKKYNIFCNESGTLTRFIIPICASQNHGSYYIHAAARMMERPIKSQLKILETLGMKVIYERDNYKLPMTIQSDCLLYKKNKMVINADESSQFLSGLLMSAPLFKNGLVIESNSEYKQPYVEMTVKLMKLFDIDVNVENNIYTVYPNQSYKAHDYHIEPDLSTASYFWALAAITNGKIKVKNVHSHNTTQGDIKFLEVIKKMGCSIHEEDDGITVYRKKRLTGVTVNMRHCSDTFMTIVSIACFAKGTTNITGLTHTRLQESDRVSAMEEELIKLGIKVKTTKDSIHIYPEESKLQSAEVDGHNDHRIAMSLSLIGLVQPNVVITGSECVRKTCPDYFERMSKMITNK